ncbi:MAG: SIS domain-containing protein [Bacteroidota bacterium]
MQLDLYKNFFTSYFQDTTVVKQISESIDLLKNKKRIFFIGNGGSNSICSHMMEDYGKIAGYKSYAFSDASLITCYANDFGYEHAIAEWLKLHMEGEDVLVAISSSGNSKNIINAVAEAKSKGCDVISLSGFKPDNELRKTGNVNFYLPVENYGIVECYHQIILHVVLDELALIRKK